jgi:ABC-2 type transport system permease protein
MKILNIAFKDLLRSYRNRAALIVMFVLPLLVTGLFYLALGNLINGDGADLPVTKVQMVNLDQGRGLAAGESLVKFLQEPRLAKLVAVTVTSDGAIARRAVDNQQAGVAVIIPSDFSSTITSAKDTAATAITLYQDPTLKVGPGIVRELLGQFLDNFNGSRIAAGVLAEESNKHSVAPANNAALQNVALQYSGWSQSQRFGEQVTFQAPPGKDANSNTMSRFIGGIMAGMMLFFVFYTGATTAESIVKEDEEGTLARLFTTPTPRSLILAGKFMTVFLTLLVQMVVLVLVSALVFGINWGTPWSTALMILGTVIVASGFGVLLNSFIKSSRQSGPIVGAVMTITGLLGGLMTTSFGDLPPFFATVNLLTPQGWVLKGWTTTLDGGTGAEFLGPFLVMVVLGLAFFAAGTLIFRKRFA